MTAPSGPLVLGLLGLGPKEVWSLVAFLAYMAILHGRIKPFGPLGVAALSIVAFLMILMTHRGELC